MASNKKCSNSAELISRILEVRYSDLENERLYCEQLLKLGTRTRDPYAICFAHTYFGDYYYSKGDFLKSEQHLIQAGEYCAMHGFSNLLLENHMFSGHLLRRTGNEQRALDAYLDGISLAESLGNNAAAANLYNGIAVIFDGVGDFEESMRCLEMAYHSQGAPGDDETLQRRYIMLLSNLAEMACRLGRIEDGKAYLKLAEDIIAGGSMDTLEVASLYVPRVFCADMSCREELQAVLDELFSLDLARWEDKSMAFDLLTSVAKYLLDAGQYDFLHHVLDILEESCHGTEYANSLMLCSIRIDLCRETGQGDTEQLYREFYENYRYANVISQDVRAAGLLAKMNLRRTMKEKAVTQARNDALEEFAYYDELTHTYNRRYLNDKLRQCDELEASRRITVAMIDIDCFKQFNDTYGHQAGDRALRTVADCLCKNIPQGGVVVRYGGDEFAALCLDSNDVEMEHCLNSVALRLSELAIEHKNSSCAAKIVSLSMGYHTAAVESAADLEMVIANADKALYISKYKGRNAITRFE